MATECECWYHRYHVVHICGCGQLIDHSQGSWDTHKNCEGRMEDYPSCVYRHGDTPGTLRARYADGVLHHAVDSASVGTHTFGVDPICKALNEGRLELTKGHILRMHEAIVESAGQGMILNAQQLLESAAYLSG